MITSGSEWKVQATRILRQTALFEVSPLFEAKLPKKANPLFAFDPSAIPSRRIVLHSNNRLRMVATRIVSSKVLREAF